MGPRLAVPFRSAVLLVAMLLVAVAGGHVPGASRLGPAAVADAHTGPVSIGPDGDTAQGPATLIPVPAKPQPARSKPSDPSGPKVAAAAVIVEDLGTGKVLFELHADARRPIASLTKIMTAMVVLSSTDPGDVVRVSRWAAAQPPTNMDLHLGWRMQVEPLLYALMLHSANDVAVALAEHVAGSTRAFDRLMNRQAAALGMTNTRFASPSGLRDAGYSSARDMAALARWAMASEGFARLVGTKVRTIELPDGHRLRLENLNDLLFTDATVTGVKTGYTIASHWSLVATASRGGHRVVAVILGEKDHPFADGERLLDYGFRLESRVA